MVYVSTQNDRRVYSVERIKGKLDQDLESLWKFSDEVGVLSSHMKQVLGFFQLGPAMIGQLPIRESVWYSPGDNTI